MAKPDKEIISAIGLGIAGLTTAVSFAPKGRKVIGIDIDPKKVEDTNQCICPIYEEGFSNAPKDVEVSQLVMYNSLLGGHNR